jgi:hypothetical protein
MAPRHTWLAVAAALACARPQPSPEYERAREMWTDLVRARGTDAADDPATDDVLALLARVPPKSLDAQAASELKARIESERKALTDERTRRDQMVAGAVQALGAPGPSPSGGGEGSAGVGGGGEGSAGAGGSGGAMAASPAEQGGAVALPQLRLGMKLDAFLAAYGTCFEDKGDVELSAPDGKAPPRAGRMWRMKDDEACRAVEPKLADKIVVFAGDELAGINPANSLHKVEHERTVELGRLPDGGLGIKSDAGVEPLPAGATLRLEDGGTTGGGPP